MKKHKFRRRLCAPYSRLKVLWKSRLSPSASPSDATSIQHRFTRIFTPPQKNETFSRTVDIRIQSVGNLFRSNYIHGVVLFDTQCEHNLVTCQFLKENGVKWQPSPDDTNIYQMDGAEIPCLGEVEGRWHPVHPHKDDNFRPRYETSTFKVVDLEEFELIIGRTTINKLGLLQPNRSWFGGFRQLPHPIDSASVTPKKQQEVEERRKKEQEEMKKYEEEQARKLKTPKPDLR